MEQFRKFATGRSHQRGVKLGVHIYSRMLNKILEESATILKCLLLGVNYLEISPAGRIT